MLKSFNKPWGNFKIINEIKCSYCNEEKGKCTKKCTEKY